MPSGPQAYGAPSAYDPSQPAAPQPYPQAPYPQQPQPVYGQQPAPMQPPYGQQPGSPYPPYPPQPPYPASEPGKRKIWPWVLCGCLLVFLLGIGGCVGCASCALLAYDEGDDSSQTYGYSDSYDYGDSSDSSSSSYTLDEIKDLLGSDLANTVEGGNCSPGVYVVGQDIDPGLYYLEGGPVSEGTYYVFDEEGADSYGIDKSVVYIGHYLAELERGDVIAYLPGDDALRMRPIAKASFAPEAPYQSGLYRVGTDIPAGEYTITLQKDAADNASYESAAYVMKDLEFDDDSITDTEYVVAGGTQTVTVKDGDYLELFAVVATPVDQAEKAS